MVIQPNPIRALGRESAFHIVFASHADLLLSLRRPHRGPERHANHDRRKYGCADFSEIHWFKSVLAMRGSSRGLTT